MNPMPTTRPARPGTASALIAWQLGGGAQVVDPGKAGPGDRQARVPAPGGDQDLGVAEFFAVVQGDHVAQQDGTGRHRGAAAQLDAVIGVPSRAA